MPNRYDFGEETQLWEWVADMFGPEWVDRLRDLAVRTDALGDLATFVIMLADYVRCQEEEEFPHEA